MPSVLSTLRDKLYGREWSFPYNCYEVGHGWTPYCTGAACDVGVAAFKNSLPLYSSLYLFTQLGLQRKFDPHSFLETFKSIITSASFLGFNFFAGVGTSCLLRNSSDRYYYRIQCFLPGLIASYMALLVERPSRRPALAFYLANMSTELIYKLAATHGYMISVPHGETVLFTFGMACWLHFVRVHGFGHDPVSSALKYLIGPLEAKSRARKRQIEHKTVEEDGQRSCQTSDEKHQQVAEVQERIRGKRRSTLMAIQENVTSFLNQFFGAHPACPHAGISCVDYSLTPIVTRFIVGYMARSMLNLSGGYRLLISNPREAVARAFTAKSSLNFGLFLSTFVGASRASHCILRRMCGEQEDWHSLIAGGLAGLSMLFSPKSTISTYIVWKCLEQYFFLAVQNGQIKYPNVVICMTYAVSCNILLYIFAIDPRLIRPSYMKFIDKISDHRLHQVNRMVLDVFSNAASKGYEDWFPDLDPKHMSREFHEIVFNWLIQPYE